MYYYKLLIAYDGYDYHGWQCQNDNKRSYITKYFMLLLAIFTFVHAHATERTEGSQPKKSPNLLTLLRACEQGDKATCIWELYRKTDAGKQDFQMYQNRKGSSDGMFYHAGWVVSLSTSPMSSLVNYNSRARYFLYEFICQYGYENLIHVADNAIMFADSSFENEAIRLDFLKTLVLEHNLDVNKSTILEGTLLHRAANACDLQVIKFLLIHGANKNAKWGKRTPYDTFNSEIELKRKHGCANEEYREQVNRDMVEIYKLLKPDGTA